MSTRTLSQLSLFLWNPNFEPNNHADPALAHKHILPLRDETWLVHLDTPLLACDRLPGQSRGRVVNPASRLSI